MPLIDKNLLEQDIIYRIMSFFIVWAIASVVFHQSRTGDQLKMAFYTSLVLIVFYYIFHKYLVPKLNLE